MTELNVLLISCSLHPQSKSAVLCAAAHAGLALRGAEAAAVDLRDVPLPLCDGHAAYASPGVGELSGRIAAADAVLLGLPVYNYGVNAAAKTLVELTGAAWTDKLVGFLLAAGGRGSYMAVMPFANSLMLDFRCVVLPRFVYATGEDFVEGGDGLGEQAAGRVGVLCDEAVRIGTALRVGANTHTPARAARR